MRRLSDADVMRVWELGRRASADRRASVLLTSAGAADTEEVFGTLTPGERDARLLGVRRLTFGDMMECTLQCPQCTVQLEFTLDASTLTGDGQSYAADSRPVTLAASGYQATVRPPTLCDVRSLVAAGDSLLKGCVLAAARDGVAVAPDALPPELIAAIDSHLAVADPAAVNELSMSCPDCGHAWFQLFDIGGFLWAEVAALAERLCREVHTLARAYGWSESAILALGPVRRERYLDLLDA